MITARRNKIFLAVALMGFSAPYMVFACSAHSNVWDPTILQGPLVSCTGAGAPGGTDNANCTSFCDFVCTAANVVYFFIGVVIWMIAPIMIAWSGISLIVSRGNSEAMATAKKRVAGTVIGLLLVICAWLIVYTFVSVIGLSGVGGFGTNACTILP